MTTHNSSPKGGGTLYRFEQFATGRFDVIAINGMRAGSIIGGKQCWQAEIGQKVIGTQYKSKVAAANAVMVANGYRGFFEQMQEILEANPDMLQHYKDDFYKIDREILEAWQCATDMLWFVRKSGTDLIELDCGFSESSGAAVLQGFDPAITGAPLHIFHLDSKSMKVKPVTAVQARRMLAETPTYDVKNDFITRYGKSIAKVEFANVPIGHLKQGVAVTVRCEEEPSPRTLLLIRRLAAHAQVKREHSLFAKHHSLEVLFGKKRLFLWERATQPQAGSQ